MVSVSEQSSRLKHNRIGQDYIQEWFDAWTVEHYFEATSEFSHEASAVFFDKGTKTVIFAQLFAMITETTKLDSRRL